MSNLFTISFPAEICGGGGTNSQSNERRMLSRGSILYKKKRGGRYLVSTGSDVL